MAKFAKFNFIAFTIYSKKRENDVIYNYYLGSCHLQFICLAHDLTSYLAIHVCDNNSCSFFFQTLQILKINIVKLFFMV